jgi:hypothetical protein
MWKKKNKNCYSEKKALQRTESVKETKTSSVFHWRKLYRRREERKTRLFFIAQSLKKDLKQKKTLLFFTGKSFKRKSVLFFIRRTSEDCEKEAQLVFHCKKLRRKCQTKEDHICSSLAKASQRTDVRNI